MEGSEKKKKNAARMIEGLADRKLGNRGVDIPRQKRCAKAVAVSIVGIHYSRVNGQFTSRCSPGICAARVTVHRGESRWHSSQGAPNSLINSHEYGRDRKSCDRVLQGSQVLIVVNRIGD